MIEWKKNETPPVYTNVIVCLLDGTVTFGYRPEGEENRYYIYDNNHDESLEGLYEILGWAALPPCPFKEEGNDCDFEG